MILGSFASQKFNNLRSKDNQHLRVGSNIIKLNYFDEIIWAILLQLLNKWPNNNCKTKKVISKTITYHLCWKMSRYCCILDSKQSKDTFKIQMKLFLRRFDLNIWWKRHNRRSHFTIAQNLVWHLWQSKVSKKNNQSLKICMPLFFIWRIITAETV